MLSKSVVWGLAAVALAAFGCSKSSENGSNSGGATPVSVNGATPQAGTVRDPKLIVTDFLEAIRKGEDEKAKNLLTKLAAQKVGKAGYSVGPAVSATTKIEVDDATFPTPEHDIAHVPTRLIDVDDAGRPSSDQATWVCRLEPEGWRVAGLAAYVFENEEPLLLSFEDPEDLAKKQQWLKDEIKRRSTPAQPVARPSGTTAPSQAARPQDAFRR